MSSDTDTQPTGLRRQLGLTGLAATGICSMPGAAVIEAIVVAIP